MATICSSVNRFFITALSGPRFYIIELGHFRGAGQYGEPHFAEFTSHRSVGTEGPIRLEDVQGISFSDTIDRITIWKPGGQRPLSPDDIEGLISTFRAYVASNAEDSSKGATQMKARPMA